MRTRAFMILTFATWLAALITSNVHASPEGKSVAYHVGRAIGYLLLGGMAIAFFLWAKSKRAGSK